MFEAHGYGVVPKFHSSSFDTQYYHWNTMRKWCEDQGWVLGCDFVANADFDRPWYFRTREQQTWFTLRWA